MESIREIFRADIQVDIVDSRQLIVPDYGIIISMRTANSFFMRDRLYTRAGLIARIRKKYPSLCYNIENDRLDRHAE